MLALEDLVDLGESLRDAGFKVSTQQWLSVQTLLLRLAAEGALPPTRAGLARWLGPVLCTSAAEQGIFEARYGAWLRRRFDEGPPPPPPPPPPVHVPQPARWRRRLLAIVGALVLLAGGAYFAVEWYVASRVIPQVVAAAVGSNVRGTGGDSAPPAKDGAPALGLTLAARFDLAPDLPDPTWVDRIVPRNLGIVLAPWAMFLPWLAWWLRRRPVLQRLASRTPPQLREVHVPGAVRTLLPSLPLRRLAQELRRRRHLLTGELQVEPTVRATLARGGQFTPVRGSHVEPDYLAFIDSSGLADHQARLAAEIVAELARSDVLVDRYDFDRNAGLLRPRALPGAARGAAAQAVELHELQERQGERRVLVFSDGAGCFDGYTGEPLPWTLVLAAWPLAVLLTPVPLARWGRREWALQRLGLQVLPLDAPGLGLLMGVMAGLGGAPAAIDAPASAAARAYERTPRRWLERDPPPDAAIEALLADLRADLGERGAAWLAACAAYPEVHWGITLRLGAALVPAPADFERLLPRLARLVWFREAYLPDWLRERLLAALSPADEALARGTLRALLEGVARGDELPLRIAIGDPVVDEPPWRRLLRRLRARGDEARTKDMLRTAPPDSPLRDHVFLRFLSGVSTRRIDLLAPGGLLAALRLSRAARPYVFALGAVLASVWLGLAWPPLLLDAPVRVLSGVQFAQDGRSATVTGKVGLIDDAAYRFVLTRSGTRLLTFEGPRWRSRELRVSGRWQQPVPGAGLVLFGDRGQTWVMAERGQPMLLPGAGDGAEPVVAFDPAGTRVALQRGERVGVWRLPTGQLERDLDLRDLRGVQSFEFSADGQRLLTAGLDVLRIWNLADGKALTLSLGNARGLGQAHFNADGGIVAASVRGALLRWVSSTGDSLQPEVVLAGSANRPFVVSPDGRQLAEWTRSTAATLHSLSNTITSIPLEDSTGLRNLQFSPDGKRLAGLDVAGRVRLWDAATGKTVGGMVNVPGGPDWMPTSIRFSPDGRLLATASGTEVALWNVDRQGPTTVVNDDTSPVANQRTANPANLAWMLAASALVALMLPGMGLLCRGLTRGSAAVPLAGTVALCAAMCLGLWGVFGYSLAYTESNDWLGGLDRRFLTGLFDAGAMAPAFSKGVYIPEWSFALFQGLCAALPCCALVAAFASRLPRRALLLVAALWFSLALVPLMHMVWFWQGPDVYTGKEVVDAVNARAGLIWQWGALDFAGGLVLYLSVATAGLVGAWMTRVLDRTPRGERPQSPALALLGAGLLWVGSMGLNAGSSLEAGNSAALALMGSFWIVAAAVLSCAAAQALLLRQPATGGVVWGLLAGLLAGLAAASSSVGNVGTAGAVVLGAVAGFATAFLLPYLHRPTGDDGKLAFFGVLWFGAVVGVLGTAVFNSQSLGGPGLVVDWVTASVGSNTVWGQVLIQGKAAFVTVLWSGAVAAAAFKLTDFLVAAPQRATRAPAVAPADSSDSLAQAFPALWGWTAALCAAGVLAVGLFTLLAQAPAAEYWPPLPASAPAAAAPVATPANVTWLLGAAALTMLGVPGLALLLGGLLRSADMAALLSRVVLGTSIVLIAWYVYGYSLVFTEGNDFLGTLDRVFLRGVWDPLRGEFASAATFSKGVVVPELLYVLFQGAVVCVAASLWLCGVAERVRSSALWLLLMLWLTLSYVPLAHMLLFWVGPDAYTGKDVVDAMNAKAGLLWQWGVLDLPGGHAVVINAALTGLVVLRLLGPADRGPIGRLAQGVPLLVVPGAAMCWLAMLGLNAGSALEFDALGWRAAANTLWAAPAAMAAWGLAERLATGSFTMRGAAVGLLAGLAAIAPAAGNVGLAGAIVTGAAGALLASVAVNTLGRWLGADAAPQFFAALAVAGMAGALLTGAFNHPSLGGPGTVVDFVTMQVEGVSIAQQLLIQGKGVLVTVVWSAAVAWISCMLVGLTVGLHPSAPTQAPASGSGQAQ